MDRSHSRSWRGQFGGDFAATRAAARPARPRCEGTCSVKNELCAHSHPSHSEREFSVSHLGGLLESTWHPHIHMLDDGQRRVPARTTARPPPVRMDDVFAQRSTRRSPLAATAGPVAPSYLARGRRQPRARSRRWFLVDRSPRRSRRSSRDRRPRGFARPTFCSGGGGIGSFALEFALVADVSALQSV